LQLLERKQKLTSKFDFREFHLPFWMMLAYRPRRKYFKTRAAGNLSPERSDMDVFFFFPIFELSSTVVLATESVAADVSAVVSAFGGGGGSPDFFLPAIFW
jgi:hypothetical protein